MAIDNFIPEVWSARLLKHLDTQLVFKQLVNTDYEGEIRSFGDTVRVNRIGDITVGDYTKNSTLSAPQALTGEQMVMVIDQAKYFNFFVDDIDQAQANVKVMDAAMERASFALAKAVDIYIAKKFSEAGIILDGTSHAGITVDPAGSSGVKPYDLLISIAQKMDENNVPEANRWVVVPPWFHAALLKSEEYKLAYQDYKTTGKIPEVAGMKILKSNNLRPIKWDSTNSVWTEGASGNTHVAMLAGVDITIAYAQQLQKIEAYRPADRFADAVKGLLVFGAKVFYPNALVLAAVKSV